MSIADVIRILGFATPDTERLASEVYSDAGNVALTFATGYVKGRLAIARADEKNAKLSDAELKKIVVRATLASSLAGFAAALVEDGVPAQIVRAAVEDVIVWIDAKKAAEKRSN